MIKGYGWVTQINGVDYYRSITNPKNEICVKNGKKVKLKKKIKHLRRK